MKTHSFLKGAAILTAAGIVSKLLGAGYRIPFFRVVGSEGIGLYQMAYPLYTMLLAVSSAGIPVAVSKLVSENLASGDIRGVNRVFLVALTFITVIAGITSVLLYQGASCLSVRVLHDQRAYYSIVAISPAIFFVGIMSVFRGYFQGFQEMVPTACSQVLEQFVRVATVLIGAYLFLPKGLQFAAAAATFGAVTGAAAGVVFLILLYFFSPLFRIMTSGILGTVRTREQGVLSILRRVVALALPISLAGLVIPVMQTLDAVTVPGRLQLAGYSVSRAAQLYGELTGGASTLINLPTVLTVSLAASIVPVVSGLAERRNYPELRIQTETAVKITVLVGLPASVGLMALASPICALLFDCPEAGIPLFYVAPAALLLGLHQTTAGVLQGMGRTILPVLNLVIGAAIKFAANYTLTTIPGVGIIGASLGTVAGFLVSSVMNCICIRYLTGWAPDFRAMLLKPAVAVTIMAVSVYFTYGLSKIIVGGSWATLLGVSVGAVIYFMSLAAMGAFRGVGFPGPRQFIRRFFRAR